MNKFTWKETPDSEAASELARELEIPPAGGRFLAARHKTDTDDARAYLEPGAQVSHDPFRFDNMKAAVEMVKAAIADTKSIMIHGDYDVDGISGTALLYQYLEGLVPDIYRFVPDRRKDGYGVATRSVDWAIENKVGLVIAVDCGTSDVELIARLETAGVGVVVCDHHRLPVDGITAGVLLNPVRDGEGYPFPSLCGAGVAFKLIQALWTSGVRGSRDPDSLLDLVALATVGDLAPLVDENRYYVRAGLNLMNRSPRPAVEAMKGFARIGRNPITAGHIAFGLAPRLNAPGRVSRPKPSLEILCESDKSRALQLASVLEGDNDRRRALTRQVQDEAVAAIREMSDRDDKGGFILAHETWDEGVLGIAAARVVEEFGRPAILLRVDGGIAKGSGRSIPGVDLKAQLDVFQDCFVRYGGHAQAVGLTMEANHFDRFSAGLSERLLEFVTPGTGLPLVIDSWLEIEECTLDLVGFLGRCEPFGYGNKQPVWKIADVQITGDTCLVGDGHLKLFFQDTRGVPGNAIAFNWTRPYGPEELQGRVADIAVTLKRGFYNGEHYAELRLVDIRGGGAA